MKTVLPYALILSSVCLYLTSLTSVAFSCSTEGFIGYQVLMYGWLGFIYLDPRWLANLWYIWMLLGLLHVPKVTVSGWVPYLTLGFAVASIPFPSAGCASAGGAAVFSNHLAIGGYLWVVATSIASLNFIWKENLDSKALSIRSRGTP